MDTAHALSAAFLAAWPGPAATDREALESALVAAARAGRAAWPEIDLDPARFAAHAGGRVDASLSPTDALAAARVADLYAAAACACGMTEAMSAVESRYFGDVRAVLGKQGIAPDKIDEVAQGMRELLFVGDASGPRIAAYRGTGDLRAWLKITATRAALKLVRAESRETPRGSSDDALFDGRAAEDDPELAYIKATYRAELKAAFQEALDSLAPRERLLLKQQIVDALTADDLARAHGVHRATAARWAQAAREKLLTRTRRFFIARSRVSGEECDSVMRLVRSQLDVTIARRLAEGA